MSYALIAVVVIWMALIFVAFSLAGAASRGDRMAERARWDGWRT